MITKNHKTTHTKKQKWKEQAAQKMGKSRQLFYMLSLMLI
jgi:hypothetical protein